MNFAVIDAGWQGKENYFQLSIQPTFHCLPDGYQDVSVSQKIQTAFCVLLTVGARQKI